ncbi:hypothetical protein AURDEDRAFT_122389 [Auricularia subglabra TFB-10046 SS5]|nr:hypothetical protein AURDEDRAFT_122389 [Auricularia subglabra TFB-10046 SS5]
MALDPVLLPSARALALSTLAEDTARARDKANDVFRAVRGIVNRALAVIAEEWNAAHDCVRRLPPELQELCFTPLPVADKCRLSLVCSHWRDNIASLPQIWTHLELECQNRDLEAFVARSAELPLDLILTVGPCRDLTPVDIAVRASAHRLRRLRIFICFGTGDTDDEDTEEEDDPCLLLPYPAPLLEDLSIAIIADRLIISPLLFRGHAPRLRKLHLCGVDQPNVCPAFSRVTTLALKVCSRALDGLFEEMPLLRHMTAYRTSLLPPLPPDAQLRTLEIINSRADPKELVELGYKRLDKLTVLEDRGPMLHWHLDMVTHLCPSNPSVMCVRRDGHTSLTFDLDHCVLTLAVRPSTHKTMEGHICRCSTRSQGVQRLVLPARVCCISYESSPPVLLGPDDVAQFPAMQTLAISCSGARDHVRSVPLSSFVQGKLHVPALARIEVVPAPDAVDYAAIERVDVEDLVWFISQSLVLDDRGALEVFVDTAHGMRLDGDPDLLRGCILRCLAPNKRALPLSALRDPMAGPLAYEQALQELLFLIESELPAPEAPAPVTDGDRVPHFASFPIAPSNPFATFSGCVATIRARAKEVAQIRLPDDDRAAFLAQLDDNILPACASRPAHSTIFSAKSDDTLCCLFLDTLRTQILGRTPDVAREWNRAHDRMRTLPTELWGPCFADLNQSERCQLLLALGLPELWDTLEIHTVDGRCGELIRRSGELHMRLTVVLRCAGDIEHLGEGLKAHMHRLRALNLVVQCADSAMTLASNATFRSSAPSLESVSFVAHGDAGATLHLGKQLFNGGAPGLHTWFVGPNELGEKGYLRIERIHARVPHAPLWLASTLERAATDGSSCSLAVSPDLSAELVLEAPDGRTARLSTALDVVCDVEDALVHPAPALRALTLPNGILCRMSGRFLFSHLEVLTVVCAEPVAETVRDLTVYAPLLRRVEYVAGADDRCYLGSPSSRDAFIRRCFRMEIPDSLEILAEAEEVTDDSLR